MGPLSGHRIVELAGIGPAPMAGMILADMGAEVIRVERPGARPSVQDVSLRGKKSITLNLKSSEGIETLLWLLEKSDALIDPYRPGVCEKLGVGPEVAMARNPGLIFGRMTGWGQTGPLSKAAGHDINYISITGALFATGRHGQKPVPPLNLVGDMGGGGMLLVNGILAALLEKTKSGKGQVIDAAMVDGAAQLMWMFHGYQAQGKWDASRRENNFIDGGAHFYDVYECADGKFVSIGSIEPQFYALLIEKAGLDADVFSDQHNKALWPDLSDKLAEVIRAKTQDEWREVMEGSDVCFAPVLDFLEAPSHPANVERETYIEVDGLVQPAPAPRFSRTPATVEHGARECGADTDALLAEIGIDDTELERLRASGAVG
jgi:alpha-methylacyl-CoA racemase